MLGALEGCFEALPLAHEAFEFAAELLALILKRPNSARFGVFIESWLAERSVDLGNAAFRFFDGGRHDVASKLEVLELSGIARSFCGGGWP